MFSLGINSHFNDEEQLHRYIIRRLMAYGLTSSGDFYKDKQLLAKIERGQLQPITQSTTSNTENFVLNTEDNAPTQSPNENFEITRQGAEQLGILMKLRLGLI